MTLDEKIRQFAASADLLPGISVIHQIEAYHPIYMSREGLRRFGLTMEEMRCVGDNYFDRFFKKSFKEEFLQELVPLIRDNKPGATFTLFHQVQFRQNRPFEWYASSVSVFHCTDDVPSHTVSLSVPIGDLEHISRKAEKFTEEARFHKENRRRFETLTDRCREVLRLVALGKSSAEIASELHISPETVNSHKKKIKQQLEISSTHEFKEYAFSFDLI